MRTRLENLQNFEPKESKMNAMKLAVTAAVLSVAVASTALAAPTTYTTDANHTYVRFSYSHMGFSTQESRFNKVSGTITFDPASKSGSVDISIDTKSVDTGSDLFNGHIQGADFLDTSTFGTATFKSTSVKFDGDKPVSISGNLTLKGVTKPVTLTVTDFKSGQNMMKKEAIGADASTKISRTAFNMGKYAPAVSDDVTLSIAVEAAAP
jgi:polyisoprenoid-binding protein YceI